MTKSAGFLKKLKKVGQLIGKGAGWVNNNVVKPLRPVIDTGLDMAGAGAAKKLLDFGSNMIDQYSGYKPSANDDRYRRFVTGAADFALDTQRAPADRKYANPFTNRLN